jgi:hypothetical protein
MIENPYERDLVMDELQKVLRAVHLVNCTQCRAQEEGSEAPTPPVMH